MLDILVMWGVPSGVTGLIIWFLKRHIDKSDKKREDAELRREQKEEKVEKLMLLILQDCRATTVLAEATARAVQRIPDAHCNGDMTKALERATEIQKREKDYVFDQGIEHIFRA